MIVNLDAVRELSIQAPHPLADADTGVQALELFERIHARSFLVSGTHRFVDADVYLTYGLPRNGGDTNGDPDAMGNVPPTSPGPEPFESQAADFLNSLPVPGDTLTTLEKYLEDDNDPAWDRTRVSVPDATVTSGARYCNLRGSS